MGWVDIAWLMLKRPTVLNSLSLALASLTLHLEARRSVICSFSFNLFGPGEGGVTSVFNLQPRSSFCLKILQNLSPFLLLVN